MAIATVGFWDDSFLLASTYVGGLGYARGGVIQSSHVLRGGSVAAPYSPVDAADMRWTSPSIRFEMNPRPYVEPETRITINPTEPTRNPTGYRARKRKARLNNGLPNGS